MSKCLAVSYTKILGHPVYSCYFLVRTFWVQCAQVTLFYNPVQNFRKLSNLLLTHWIGPGWNTETNLGHNIWFVPLLWNVLDTLNGISKFITLLCNIWNLHDLNLYIQKVYQGYDNRNHFKVLRDWAYSYDIGLLLISILFICLTLL